jgi:hypothetical protein
VVCGAVGGVDGDIVEGVGADGIVQCIAEDGDACRSDQPGIVDGDVARRAVDQDAGAGGIVEAVQHGGGETDRTCRGVGDDDHALPSRALRDRAGIGDGGRATGHVERRAARAGDRGAGAEAERTTRAIEDVDAGIAAIERRRAIEIIGAVSIVELQAGAASGR